MADITKREYKNIIGDTKATIDAIQKFLAKNSSEEEIMMIEEEEQPCEGLNRILNSVVSTSSDIEKIISSL